MISLRPLTEQDVTIIKSWPPYPGDMEQMDYALREKGWLDEFHGRADAFLFGVVKDQEIIGFTVLAMTGTKSAEFRIALRADRTGKGLGEQITRRTLQLGFAEYGLSRIHLIVRKNNVRAIRLYHRIGFEDCDECRRVIMGQVVEFWEMDLDRKHYDKMQKLSKKGDHYDATIAQGLGRDRRAE